MSTCYHKKKLLKCMNRIFKYTKLHSPRCCSEKRSLFSSASAIDVVPVLFLIEIRNALKSFWLHPGLISNMLVFSFVLFHACSGREVRPTKDRQTHVEGPTGSGRWVKSSLGQHDRTSYCNVLIVIDVICNNVDHTTFISFQRKIASQRPPLSKQCFPGNVSTKTTKMVLLNRTNSHRGLQTRSI